MLRSTEEPLDLVQDELEANKTLLINCSGNLLINLASCIYVVIISLQAGKLKAVLQVFADQKKSFRGRKNCTATFMLSTETADSGIAIYFSVLSTQSAF